MPAFLLHASERSLLEMSDRPMHTVPGLFERLTALYADGVRALADGRPEDAVSLFSDGIQLDDEFRQGYVYANDKPGLGVDLDEAEAAKYPCDSGVTTWTQTRLPDGTLQTP